MNDSALNLVDRGRGDPALVLIHGFTCDLSSWKEQLTGISNSHRCVAIDLPGHGASADSPEATIEALAAAANATLDGLQLDEAVLVGHSMGCRVISEMASQSPQRVRGVVYVDGSIVSRSDVDAAVKGAAEKLDRIGMQAFIRHLYEGFWVPGTPAAAREFVMAGMPGIRMDFAKKLWPNVVRWDGSRVRPVLAGISVPALVIQSTTLDTDLNRASLLPGQSTPWVDAVTQALGDVTVAVIEGVGHFPMLEAPQKTNDVILEFVRRLGKDSGGGQHTV
jgi:pimeloyl-ACP methyl ester carboxylesterase